MPQRVTLRAAVAAVAVAFGVTALVAVQRGDSSAARAPVKAVASKTVADTPGGAPDLRLAGSRRVPALRDPRKPRVRRKPKPVVRRVVPAPAPVRQAPTATPKPKPKPAATAAPRYVPPAPAPAPARPRPAPTAPPPSGQFDTGDSGDFDTTGQ
jgi:hypothetical protein